MAAAKPVISAEARSITNREETKRADFGFVCIVWLLSIIILFKYWNKGRIKKARGEENGIQEPASC
jgi:hypothetical protein